MGTQRDPTVLKTSSDVSHVTSAIFCRPEQLTQPNPLSVEHGSTILCRHPMAMGRDVWSFPREELDNWEQSCSTRGVICLLTQLCTSRAHPSGWLSYSSWLSVFNFHFFLFGILRIGKPESSKARWTFRDLVSCFYFSGRRINLVRLIFLSHMERLDYSPLFTASTCENVKRIAALLIVKENIWLFLKSCPIWKTEK